MKDDFEYAYTITTSTGLERKIYKSKSDPHRFKVELGEFKSWTDYLQDQMSSGQVNK